MLEDKGFGDAFGENPTGSKRRVLNKARVDLSSFEMTALGCVLSSPLGRKSCFKAMDQWKLLVSGTVAF